MGHRRAHARACSRLSAAARSAHRGRTAAWLRAPYGACRRVPASIGAWQRPIGRSVRLRRHLRRAQSRRSARRQPGSLVHVMRPRSVRPERHMEDAVAARRSRSYGTVGAPRNRRIGTVDVWQVRLVRALIGAAYQRAGLESPGSARLPSRGLNLDGDVGSGWSRPPGMPMGCAPAQGTRSPESFSMVR